jgi:hypothetical protein
LNFTPSSAGTVFLFGGDAVYDPVSGLYMNGDGTRDRLGFEFIQMDAASENNQDPISLHRYLYADADPIDNNDPTGHFALIAEELLSDAIEADLQYSNAITTTTTGALIEEDGSVVISALESSQEDAIGYAEVEEAGGEFQTSGGQTVNADRLEHVFGQGGKHNVGPLVSQFGGSQMQTFNAVYDAVQSLGLPAGVIAKGTTVIVNGFTLNVTGNIINGVLNLSNFWIKK